MEEVNTSVGRSEDNVPGANETSTRQVQTEVNDGDRTDWCVFNLFVSVYNWIRRGLD